jgi:hypothetical protein
LPDIRNAVLAPEASVAISIAALFTETPSLPMVFKTPSFGGTCLTSVADEPSTL